MDNTAISWHRRLYGRLRGWGGPMVGIVIGAAAFGASTAGAGSARICRTRQGPAEIREECAEGCDQEEKNEWVWRRASSRQSGRRRPPPTPVRLADKADR